jgi:hypothetical protein
MMTANNVAALVEKYIMSLLCFECAGVKRGRCLLRNYELIKIVFRHGSLLPVAACVLKKFNGHKHPGLALGQSLSRAESTRPR